MAAESEAGDRVAWFSYTSPHGLHGTVRAVTDVPGEPVYSVSGDGPDEVYLHQGRFLRDPDDAEVLARRDPGGRSRVILV